MSSCVVRSDERMRIGRIQMAGKAGILDLPEFLIHSYVVTLTRRGLDSLSFLPQPEMLFVLFLKLKNSAFIDIPILHSFLFSSTVHSCLPLIEIWISDAPGAPPRS